MTLAAIAPQSRAAKIKSGDDWLTRKEAAIYLSDMGFPMTVRALEKRAANNNAGKGPSFTQFSWKCVKYLRRDLDEWALKQTKRIT